jgi:hypothetical protein
MTVVGKEVIPPPTPDYTPFATKLKDAGANWVFSWAPWVTQVRTLEALRAVRADQAEFKEGPRAKTLADLEAALTDLNAKLTSLYTALQEADAAPTSAMVETAAELRRQVSEALLALRKGPAR